MKDPALAGRIIEKMSAAVKCPVTVKFRKGFDEGHINAVEFAHIMEESGAAALTVHGRTRDQFYSGSADWDIIKKVKERVFRCSETEIYLRQRTPSVCYAKPAATAWRSRGAQRAIRGSSGRSLRLLRDCPYPTDRPLRRSSP